MKTNHKRKNIQTLESMRSDPNDFDFSSDKLLAFIKALKQDSEKIITKLLNAKIEKKICDAGHLTP